MVEEYENWMTVIFKGGKGKAPAAEAYFNNCWEGKGKRMQRVDEKEAGNKRAL
jgi:hypothetical protein